MTVLNRSDIPAPVVPAETVEVPSLGGELIVRGLMLSQRIALYNGIDAQGYGLIPSLLAVSVVDAAQQPLWTVEQWDAFGAQHGDDAMRLFAVAKRLSGMEAEAEKNG